MSPRTAAFRVAALLVLAAVLPDGAAAATTVAGGAVCACDKASLEACSVASSLCITLACDGSISSLAYALSAVDVSKTGAGEALAVSVNSAMNSVVQQAGGTLDVWSNAVSKTLTAVLSLSSRPSALVQAVASGLALAAGDGLQGIKPADMVDAAIKAFFDALPNCPCDVLADLLQGFCGQLFQDNKDLYKTARKTINSKSKKDTCPDKLKDLQQQDDAGDVKGGKKVDKSCKTTSVSVVAVAFQVITQYSPTCPAAASNPVSNPTTSSADALAAAAINGDCAWVLAIASGSVSGGSGYDACVQSLATVISNVETRKRDVTRAVASFMSAAKVCEKQGNVQSFWKACKDAMEKVVVGADCKQLQAFLKEFTKQALATGLIDQAGWRALLDGSNIAKCNARRLFA